MLQLRGTGHYRRLHDDGWATAMLTSATDAALVRVWVAMADHFLDTETRQDIPFTALTCVEAGLSVDEARHVFRYEVTPAVGFNMFSVAGEWAGWDEAWLIARVSAARRRARRWPKALLRLLYSANLGGIGDVFEAIAGCMALIAQHEGSEDRMRLARDLHLLASNYFDFVPVVPEQLGDQEAQRLRGLYPEPFTAAMRVALVEGEETAAQQRVDALLAGCGL